MAPQMTLYAAGPGPNPIKVLLALTALGLEYQLHNLTLGDVENGVKSAEYLKICGNGRAPALVDHSNNDFTVWESGAILYYLGEKYDKDGNLLGRKVEEKTLVQQWVYFQMSGLGPVQGNLQYAFLGYFRAAFGEEAPASFIARFDSEAKRLYGVLDEQLAKQKANGSPWLVLDRVTMADYAFFPWVYIAAKARLDLSPFPHVQAWFKQVEADEVTKKAYAAVPPRLYSMPS